ETIAEGDAMAETASDGNGTLDSTDPATGETAPSGGYTAVATENTASVPGEVVSSYAIMVNTQTGEIMAQKNAKTIINPASMTKVLTVLVAAEHVTDLDDTFTITQEITDYSFKNDCSNVGWEVGEVVTVRDLFFGTVLPSGGDAAVGLAEYVAGSHEAFVDLMNQKLEQLGLSSTAHFTNCVGLYDENHYCTVYDMAMILQAALDNPICREALSAKTYTTTATEQHPEGLLISNWFLRRIEDKDAGGFVLAGKTGYVVESGSCAASCALDGEENEYICVTANSTSSWRCIYDHVEIYKTFLPQES
ncbi:MAG: D-alanyl-D-alanine carboxypeptidase, partial [Lachnospiraceae bacterium]|nr:D-alanyl-D-alanine carboxypeptidase [Lachnospiraceae bacterium]